MTVTDKVNAPNSSGKYDELLWEKAANFLTSVNLFKISSIAQETNAQFKNIS